MPYDEPQTKKWVVCNRASLCRTYITCARVQTMLICRNFYNTTLEAPGRTQPLTLLVCDFFCRCNRNHCISLFLWCLCLPRLLFMYVCAQKPPNMRNRDEFIPLVNCVENVFHVPWYILLCVIEHRCVCSYSFI